MGPRWPLGVIKALVGFGLYSSDYIDYKLIEGLTISRKNKSPKSGLRNGLLVLTLFVSLISSLHAQTVTAPDQCQPTPNFPIGSVGQMCPQGTVPVPLFSESFDSGFGRFMEDTGSTNGLTVSLGGDTPSFGTGPETTASCRGNSNRGEFIFLEPSFTSSGEKHCMSSTIDLTNATIPTRLSFWYHMFGSNIGELEVKIDDSSEFAISGQQQTANGQAWRQATIDLAGKAGNMIDVQICMSEGDGAVSTFTGDTSIDQVEVYGCAPPETDILDFLPAILATVERKPPPPPPPARWRVTNLVYCPSFFSEWTVSDGTTSRSSLVRSQVILESNTSSYVTVEPGNRTFSWRLRTEFALTTCGAFGSSFVRNLKPGYDYEFTLQPNGGGLTIDTDERKR